MVIANQLNLLKLRTEYKDVLFGIKINTLEDTFQAHGGLFFEYIEYNVVHRSFPDDVFEEKIVNEV